MKLKAINTLGTTIFIFNQNLRGRLAAIARYLYQQIICFLTDSISTLCWGFH